MPQRVFIQHLFAFLVVHAEDIEAEHSSMSVEGREDDTLRIHHKELLGHLKALGRREFFDQLKRLYEFQGRDMGFFKVLEAEIFNTSFSVGVESPAIDKRSPNFSRTEYTESLDFAFSHSGFMALHIEATKPNGKPGSWTNIDHWINQPDTFGFMPLHHALRTGNRDMVNCLIVNGADVEAKDFRGHTALHFACGFGDEDSIGLLLKMVGAKFDVQGADGAFPLHVAAAEGNDISLAFLNPIEPENWGIPLDEWEAKDFDGRLPVHWAVLAGRTQLFTMDGPKRTTLTQYVNETDNYGWTALHLAVLHNMNGIVGELCSENWDEDFCVDKEKTDTKGLTAFQLAEENGNSEAADILRDAGARTEF